MTEISGIHALFFGPTAVLTRLRLLMTSVLRLIGRGRPCSFKNNPHALQSTEPNSSRRHNGVVLVPQFWHCGFTIRSVRDKPQSLGDSEVLLLQESHLQGHSFVDRQQMRALRSRNSSFEGHERICFRRECVSRKIRTLGNRCCQDLEMRTGHVGWHRGQAIYTTWNLLHQCTKLTLESEGH